jgi:hypothetical protein
MKKYRKVVLLVLIIGVFGVPKMFAHGKNQRA